MAYLSVSTARADVGFGPGRSAGRVGQEVVRGRAAERKMIRDLLRRAQRGAGDVLLVDGEPGSGKSLLRGPAEPMLGP